MTTLLAEFTVVGTPVPQGSNRAFIRGGKPRVIAGNQGALEKWRGDIRSALTAGGELGRRMGGELVAGPISMRLTFRFARPKGHFLPANAKRPRPELRAGAPHDMEGGPDLDKLCRAVLDALTGIVYVDDRQVIVLGANKLYAAAETPGPGVDVRVSAL